MSTSTSEITAHAVRRTRPLEKGIVAKPTMLTRPVAPYENPLLAALPPLQHSSSMSTPRLAMPSGAAPVSTSARRSALAAASSYAVVDEHSPMPRRKLSLTDAAARASNDMRDAIAARRPPVRPGSLDAISTPLMASDRPAVSIASMFAPDTPETPRGLGGVHVSALSISMAPNGTMALLQSPTRATATVFGGRSPFEKLPPLR